MELLLASKQWNKLAHFIFLIWLWSPLISETFACVCQKFQLLLFLTLNMFFWLLGHNCRSGLDPWCSPCAIDQSPADTKLQQLHPCSWQTWNNVQIQPAAQASGKNVQIVQQIPASCSRLKKTVCKKISLLLKTRKKIYNLCKKSAIYSSLGKNIVQKISQLCKQFPLSFFLQPSTQFFTHN